MASHDIWTIPYTPEFHMPRIEFDATDIASGHTIENGGHTFTVTKITPYTRKTDGEPSRIIDWQGTCAECGKPIACQTGNGRGGWFSLRHRRCYVKSLQGRKHTKAKASRSTPEAIRATAAAPTSRAAMIDPTTGQPIKFWNETKP